MAALECVKQFSGAPACVIVKHANPCGVAIATTTLEAYSRAFITDKESAFGGIIAFNCELDERTAKKIVDQQFVEVIIVPRISSTAVDVIAAKKNIRLLRCGEWAESASNDVELKKVMGGLLVQDYDNKLSTELTTVSKNQPSANQFADLEFCLESS